MLSTRDGLVLIVGLVVGAGIFRTPPLVASHAADGTAFLLLWIAGGAIALIGALCYAELASTHPHAGGEYHVLGRAFGPFVAFLLGWSRLAVLQTGSIALLAFLFADYAVRLFPVTPGVMTTLAIPAVAGLIIILFTLVNAAGLRLGKRTQYVFTAAEFAGLLAIVVAGCAVAWLGATPEPIPSQDTTGSANLALAMVFVFLTYGGWSEAAYISAELRDEQRGVQRTLVWGVVIVTILYLIVNAAYLMALGLGGVAASSAVAVDVMQRATGEWGAMIVGVIVMAAALSSINATMITSARGSFAVGTDNAPLRALGMWQTTPRDDGGAPRRALFAQAVVALLLVAFGAAARSGFESMVAYTAPVFWLTLLLMGIALFVLRNREPDRPRPFRVPLYPLLPALFCATSAYMCYSSIMYAGRGALLGVAVLLAGIPLFLVGRAKASSRDSDTSIPSFTTTP